MNKIAVTKEQEHFLKHVANKVVTDDGRSYYFIPYWYRETQDCAFYEEFSFDELPSDLKEELKRQRN